MKHLKICKSPIELNLKSYRMAGEPIINQTRKLKDLIGIFQHQDVFAQMDQEQLAYTVQSWLPVTDGTPGGLFFGASTIYPGKVGNEYFMTIEMVINQAKPAALMPAYVEIDGIPCHANNWLLKKKLRQEWGFKGLVTSDFGAVDQLWKKHFVVSDTKEAACMAFEARVDTDFPNGANYPYLNEPSIPFGKVCAIRIARVPT